MKDRKMVAIGEEHHDKLRELAEFYHRSITNETEWLIESAYRELYADIAPSVSYHSLIEPGVQQEEG